MDNNMRFYEEFRACPQEAKKPITAGRLKGKTDINPMWRIKRLTEVFGPVGLGWITTIDKHWIEEGANGERTANVQISLKVKYNGEWSEPIPGIGGAALVAKENSGLYTSDECFKMAYTDAMSVACKALGIAADVYFERDTDSKYRTEPQENIPKQNTVSKYQQIKNLVDTKPNITIDSVNAWILKKYGMEIRINELNDEQFKDLYNALTVA